MRSSNATAAVSATSTALVSPSTACVRVSTATPVGCTGTGLSRSRTCAMERNSERAAAGVALGRRRATTFTKSNGRGRVQ